MSGKSVADTRIVLYVGARKLVLLEGTGGEDEPKVRRCERAVNPDGFEGGLVTNLERASAAVEALVAQSPALREAESPSVYVVLGNSKLKTYGFSSSEYYQGGVKSVTPAEIRSVVDQTKSVSTLPLSEHILQAIPESFLVNDMANIRNPLGLEASRLGVTLRIFTMNYQDFKNLDKVLDLSDIAVDAYFPKSLAVSEAVLSAVEKEAGAVMIDIADHYTELVIWSGGFLLGTKIIPLGARYLTEKISAEWGIDARDAERLKETYASLSPAEAFGEELIPLVERNGRGPQSVSRRAFQKKFVAHCEEWMRKILAETDDFVDSYQVKYPHYVYTGGGMRFDGFLEFLQARFSREGRIGLAHGIEAPTEVMADPSLTAALGMFRCAAQHERDHARYFGPTGFVDKMLTGARNWFSNYF